MQIAVIAGGLATRLGDLTKNKPKSMIEIQGKPFLAYQIDFLKSAGFENILLCLGHVADQIQDYFGDGRKFGVNLSYSIEDKRLGTAGALKNAEHLLEDIFFTIYGDSYLFLDYRDIMRRFIERDKLAMMTVYKNDDLYDKSNTLIEGDIVTKYSKTDRDADMVYIDYGSNVFRKEVLSMVPEDEFSSLEDLFGKLIEKRELLAYETKTRFYEIGSLTGLEELTDYIARGK